MEKTTSMLSILEHIIKLYEEGYNPILILDIDDTVLSSKHGKKFTDKNIVKIVEYVDNISFDNLWFLTARNTELKRKTQNHLNHAKLLHKGKFIMYNVIHSPYYYGEPTKGTTLIDLIPRIEMRTNINKITDKNWYIIVDDDLEQVNNMLEHLDFKIYNYSMFNFIN